jgi:hypothetical protein
MTSYDVCAQLTIDLPKVAKLEPINHPPWLTTPPKIELTIPKGANSQVTHQKTKSLLTQMDLWPKTRLPDEAPIFSAELFAILVKMERLTDDLLLADSPSSL